ncbi:MAG: hypothetical protein QM487_02175 [Candidatus Marithrix sp.]
MKIKSNQLKNYLATLAPIYLLTGDELLQMKEVTVQYRFNQSDNWITAFIQPHSRARLSELFKFDILTNIQPTNDAQIRIILSDDQNVETIKTSELFAIYSNSLEVSIAPVSSNYSVGDSLTYQITGDVPNGIARFEVILKCGFRYDNIHTEVSKSNTQGIALLNSYQWPIPNSSFFAASDCHLDLHMNDLRANRIEVSSSHFAIQTIDTDGDGIANDIDPDDDIAKPV